MDLLQRASSYLKLKSNSFEKLKRSHGSSKNSCQHTLIKDIGQLLCSRIDAKKLTVERAIEDILESVDLRHDPQTRFGYCGTQNSLIWLELHLALGLCFHYRLKDRDFVRRILLKLLTFSKGVDVGIFLRQLLQWEDGSPALPIPAKSLYFLGICAGFRIKLSDSRMVEQIFPGPNKVHYSDLIKKKSCLYLDLPTGKPPSTRCDSPGRDASLQGVPLHVACMNVKPRTLLVLLRFGATPHGRPLHYLLQTLGSINLFSNTRELPIFSAQPVDLLCECLNHCMKAITILQLRYSGQRMRDMEVEENVYDVQPSINRYLPDEGVTIPVSLKHACRCTVRDHLLELDKFPGGLHHLDIPNDLVAYLQF